MSADNTSAQAMSGPPQAVQVPSFSGSSFTLLGTQFEVGLLINGNAPAIDAEGVVGLATVPQLYLRLAPVVAKELLLLLSGYVEQIEKDVGVLTSPFISQKAE